nr:MAG TPA_asm: hypothetical protein [Bacteriophage sp.]
MNLLDIDQSPKQRDWISSQNGLQRQEIPINELGTTVLTDLNQSLTMIFGRKRIEDAKKDILLMVILLLEIITSF